MARRRPGEVARPSVRAELQHLDDDVHLRRRHALAPSTYYANINAPTTLSASQQRDWFNSGGVEDALYYNGGDLGFGRDMHCKKTGSKVACYVGNYGSAEDLEADYSSALFVKINGTKDAFATIAIGSRRRGRSLATSLAAL